ncbi:MAG: hypothetical protein KKD05_10765 [Candidatus Omnitrophica bacterium]|nr:hypothetical protein [Candidatus Omnitrophota bacterium]
MKINLKERIIERSLYLFLVLVLFYGFMELIILIPSVKIFLSDPFYIASLEIKGLEKGKFWHFLIYMNTNLIVIFSSSILYIFFSIQGLLSKKGAIISIKYLSWAMLIYNLLELILFPSLTKNELKGVFNDSSIIVNTINGMFYFKYIILYVVMIFLSHTYFEKIRNKRCGLS